MEPHASTAWIESDGVLTVSTSTQGIFYVRKQLAKIFGRPMNKVRVRAAPLGGSFGSKVVLVDPLAAGAALALRRPVRVAFDRREDMAGTNPAPGSRIDVRIGATADGTLTGLDARLVFDTGAYIEWSIEGIAAVLIGGAYRWSAFDVRAYGVRTNRFGTGLLPRAGRSAGGLRARVPHRRAGEQARHRRDRAPDPQPGRRGRPDGRRRAMAGSRPRGGPRGGPGASAVAGPARPAARRGGRGRVRRVARWQGSRRRPVPAQRGRLDHDHDRRRRHERHDRRVPGHRRRDVRDRPVARGGRGARHGRRARSRR